MAVVKINALEVPEGGGEELERRFAARMGAVEGTAGFLGFELLRPVSGESRYFVYTRWESDEAFAAWSAGGARAAHARPGAEGRGEGSAADSSTEATSAGSTGDGARPRPVATGASLLEFEVVQATAPR